MLLKNIFKSLKILKITFEIKETVSLYKANNL